MRLIGTMLLCLITVACASKGNWKQDHIDSGSAEFNSSRLSFVLPDTRNHLQLELLRTKNACHGYLCVNSLSIPFYQNDPKAASISILIGEETISCLAKRHEGGHRVLLSKEILDRILNALEKGKEVTITASGYQTILKPEGFSAQYKKFQKDSLLSRLL